MHYNFNPPPIPFLSPTLKSPKMKLLSPSSTTSSASVATTSSSYEGATGSCLAGVLRRIFCSDSLHAFPVGCTNAKVLEFSSREEEFDPQAATPVPGIVARLMGLETLPHTMKIRGEKSPVSVSRSRSMNDLDYREKCDEDGDHRSSIKSTSSFRETPTYLKIENEEFMVLIFENGMETEEHGHGMGSGTKKRKKRRNRTSILMKKESNSLNENSAVEQNPESVEMSSLAKLRNVKSDEREIIPTDKQVEIKCCSENSSSPVSVLEFDEFIASDLEASTSDEWAIEDYNDSEKRSDSNLHHEQSSRPNVGSRRKDIQKQRSHPEAQILLHGIHIREITRCNVTWKYEEASGDICKELGGQISEELIDDLIGQLSCVSRKNFDPQE